MDEYREAYLSLFNAVTDVEEQLDKLRSDIARAMIPLQSAQAVAKEIYINQKEDKCDESDEGLSKVY